MWHQRCETFGGPLPLSHAPILPLSHAPTLPRSHALTLLCLAMAWAAQGFGQGEGGGLRFELDAARRERVYATNSARRVASDAYGAARAELQKLARLEGRVLNLDVQDESPIYRDRRLAASGLPVPGEGTSKEGGGRTPKLGPGPAPLSPLGRVRLEQRLHAEAKLVADERGSEAKGRGERYTEQLSWAQSWSKDAEEQREVRDRKLREEIARSVTQFAEQMEREAGGGKKVERTR